MTDHVDQEADVNDAKPEAPPPPDPSPQPDGVPSSDPTSGYVHPVAVGARRRLGGA